MNGIRYLTLSELLQIYEAVMEASGGSAGIADLGLIESALAQPRANNRRHRRVRHLTQGRYKAQLVEGNDYLLKLSRDIHLNPVCGKVWAGVPVTERRDQLQQQATQRVHRPEDVAFRRVSGGRPIEAVLRVVAIEFGTSESALRKRSRNGAARGAAAWALVPYAGLTQRAAAEVLGMGTGAAVSQQVAKWRRAVLLEPRWRTMESRLEQALAAANF